MGRSRFCSAEQIPRCIEPATGKSLEHRIESVKSEAWHILKEYERGVGLAEHALELGPEPALVGLASPEPGAGEGLAGEAARDEIHAAAPCLAVEDREIVPYRRSIQGLVCHPPHESGRRKGVPFDVTHSSVARSKGELESELEPSNPGT